LVDVYQGAIEILRTNFNSNWIDAEDSNGASLSDVVSGAGAYFGECTVVRVVSCSFLSNVIYARKALGAAITLFSSQVSTRAVFFQSNVINSRVLTRNATFATETAYWLNSGAVQIQGTQSAPLQECAESSGATPSSGICFSQCDFSSNVASRGSSMYLIYGAVTVVGCAFHHNRAEAFNPAIGINYGAAEGQVLPISNTTFIYNSSCYENVVGSFFAGDSIYRGYTASCLEVNQAGQVEISNCAHC
jgi:hypothetical protein